MISLTCHGIMNKLVVMATNDRCLQSALGDLAKNKKERHVNSVIIFYY